MMACVYGSKIALRLPQLSIAILLDAAECSLFQPFDRHPMPRWLAFDADSVIFASLDDLFEESFSFVSELVDKDSNVVGHSPLVRRSSHK